MSVSPDQAELDELLAPSIESIIAKARHHNFPWSRGQLATHLPLDPTALEVLCRVNLPKFTVRRYGSNDLVTFTDHGFERKLKFTCQPIGETKPEKKSARLCLTVRQCNSYLNAIKSMRDVLQAKGRKVWGRYGPSMYGGPGNYSLESRRATGVIWVHLTTVVELQHTNYEDSGTVAVIDVRALATILDKAMNDHEGPISTIPKACITSANIPAHFTLDKLELLKFEFSFNTDSHMEFVMKQTEKAFVVDKAANYGPIDGRTAEGVFNNELGVMCTQVKAKAQLVIRISHKTSMWPTEKVFSLECYSRFDASDPDTKFRIPKSFGDLEDWGCLDGVDGLDGFEPFGGLENTGNADNQENVAKDEPASS